MKPTSLSRPDDYLYNRAGQGQPRVSTLRRAVQDSSPEAGLRYRLREFLRVSPPFDPARHRAAEDTLVAVVGPVAAGTEAATLSVRNRYHPRVTSEPERVYAQLNDIDRALLSIDAVERFLSREGTRIAQLAQAPVTHSVLAGKTQLSIITDDRVLARLVFHVDASGGHVTNVEVDGELQGMGVATRLIDEMIARNPGVTDWDAWTKRPDGHRFFDYIRKQCHTNFAW